MNPLQYPSEIFFNSVKHHDRRKQSTLIWRYKLAEEQFQGKEEGFDFIVCQICGFKGQDLANHIKQHGYNSKRYKEEFNVRSMKCQLLIDKVKGEKNPGYQHGGKFSKWSKNFINGYDEEAHLENNLRQKERMSSEESKKKSIFCREHYDSDEEYLAHQSKNLDFFINKYGEVEGKKRYEAKTEKWLNNFKKTKFSKISQELFNEIAKDYNLDYVFYATYNRPEMDKYLNKEYHLKLSNGHYVLPDFIDLQKRKIIEFDGSYFHREGRTSKERDDERDRWLIKDGYEVFHVLENDYVSNKPFWINECLTFLSSSSNRTHSLLESLF